MKTDIIVIGSGFAGAVAAARFAGQGLQVLLLERGPWRETPAVKAAGIYAEKQTEFSLTSYSSTSGPKTNHIK